VDPPPPYQLTDPTPTLIVDASISLSTNQIGLSPQTATSQNLPTTSQCGPMPIRLPNAPPPQSLTTGCSVLPLIPGPSDSQCGPKPGRRKPKNLQQQQKKEVPLQHVKRYKRQDK
jgi:hypothetical protein